MDFFIMVRPARAAFIDVRQTFSKMGRYIGK
jgi:hypothetical protein